MNDELTFEQTKRMRRWIMDEMKIHDGTCTACQWGYDCEAWGELFHALQKWTQVEARMLWQGKQAEAA